ncbi:hypothetical protein Emed_004002 [Eimeria media]
MAARGERSCIIRVTLQLLFLALLTSVGHCSFLHTNTSGTGWEAWGLLVTHAPSAPSFTPGASLSSRRPHCAFLLERLAPQLKLFRRAAVRSTARPAATDNAAAAGAAAPASVTRVATPPAVAETEPLSLLERVQLHQDVGAAEQLLRQWEEQRDVLLLTSWNDWAAAVGVSVEQLQQVVLLVLTASAPATPTKQRRSRRMHAVSADISAAEKGGGDPPTKPISCAGGVLSAAAYDLLLSLLHAEAALLLKGPQSSRLLSLRRPPSVQEWAAVAAADAAAADAAAVAAHAVHDGSDFSKTFSASAKEVDTSQLAANVEVGCDLNATEKQQRAALYKQLSALHALMSWQQQQLSATATAAVRKFRGAAASRQEQRAAAAEGGGDAESAAAAAAAAAGGSSQDGLLLMALQHAREGLKKHALDALEALRLNSSAAAARSTEKDSPNTTSSQTNSSSSSSSSSSDSSSSSSSDSSSSSISSSSKGSSPAAPSWITYWGWLQQGMTRWGRMQRVPYEIPTGWWAAAAALRREEQQQRMRLAAEEIWKFAAANLKPEQLHALQQAAESPYSPELQTREPLLQSAVQRLRQAELKRLMQQLPKDRRAAAETDPTMQRQLLAEQSHLVRLVRDACS